MLCVLQGSASADTRQTDLQSIGPSGGSGALDATYAGASQDGTVVFFLTLESLVPADTDTAQDLYMRANGVTTLISIGPVGGNSSLDDAIYDAVSADGSYAYFSTTEKLTSNDTDTARDVYQWHNGTVTLVSIGPVGGNGAIDAFYIGNSDDGTKVWFDTTEKLTSDDTDGIYQDVYQSSGGTTTLISTGPTGGSGAFHAYYLDHSADGSHVYFQTGEAEVAGDTDGVFQDVYDRSGGTTTLVSTGPVGGNGAFDASYGGLSADASHVFFMTKEALTTDDTDTSRDVFDRSGGTTTRASTGPSGGNGAYNANFVGASQDGSKVWFETREPLVASDTDSGCLDAFGNPVLTCNDVYERSSGSTSLISCCGNGAFDASYSGASLDGSKVFFRTGEAQTVDDTDGTYQDVFQRAAGTTTLLSGGTNGPHDVFYTGASSDGSRVFFQTNESLLAADTDGGYQDVYERNAGSTYLLSTGPTTTNAAISAFYGGSSKDGLRVFFETAEALTTADIDGSQDVYQSSVVQPGYPRPKGASPMRVALVPAFTACTSANNAHGAPLAYGSCGPPVQTSQQLTIGSPDANGTQANFVGSIKLVTIVGNPSTPADEADVRLTTAISDVRVAPTLVDYTGQLQAAISVQITDRLSGSAPQDPATVQAFTFKWAIPCTATVATNVGSSCALDTTADAILPGAVPESARSIWELGQVRVFDGGSDGIASTDPNTLFAVQGVLVP
jgi:hypothetical protein